VLALPRTMERKLLCMTTKSLLRWLLYVFLVLLVSLLLSLLGTILEYFLIPA
jgi:hypothetical protein